MNDFVKEHGKMDEADNKPPAGCCGSKADTPQSTELSPVAQTGTSA